MTGPSVRRPGDISPGRNGRPPDTQILVVDDHVAFAEALAFTLGEVAGILAFAATTVERARRVLAEHDVDVVLLEVDLAGGDAIRFARQTLSENPGLRIVAVTASEDDSRAVAAVRAGISGWVPKQEPVQQLVSVVHGVLRSETWIPPRLLTRVLAELTSAQDDAAGHDQPLAKLTRREKEVLDCLMSGMKTGDIARRLRLSRSTLRTHIQNILRKLGVHSILAAVALARRSGLAHRDQL
jgi:DNA-binding NarL/FixJ family response regulator